MQTTCTAFQYIHPAPLQPGFSDVSYRCAFLYAITKGVSSRDAAAALRGHKVYVLEDEEVDLDENEYMVRDLVGGRAYRQDDESVYIGEVVGVVLGSDISSTAGLASDMLELRLPLENPGDVPKECYIPFVPALVPVVRIGAGNCTILMDLPEGLLDLAVEVEEKVVVRGFLPPASEDLDL